MWIWIECFQCPQTLVWILDWSVTKILKIMDILRGVTEVVSEHCLRITEIFDMLTCKIYWGLMNYSDWWKFSLMYFRNLGWWGHLVLLFHCFWLIKGNERIDWGYWIRVAQQKHDEPNFIGGRKMDDANGEDIWYTKLFWYSKDFFCHVILEVKTYYWRQQWKEFLRINGKNDKNKFTNKNMIGNESVSNNKRVKTFGFEMGSHHKRLNQVWIAS